MNDLVRGLGFKGKVMFRDQDIYSTVIDPVAVRRHIGMVLQQPNPFGGRTGYMIEYGDTRQIFENPREQSTREYIRGE
jgi:phosphate transport system ATP-binding protein